MNFISPKVFIKLHYSRSDLFAEAEKIKDETKRYKVVCQINDKIREEYFFKESEKQERVQRYVATSGRHPIQNNEVYKGSLGMVSMVRFNPSFKIYLVRFSIHIDHNDNLYISEEEYMDFCRYGVSL